MNYTIQNFIASRRQERNWRQEEVAQTVGVSRQTLSALEKGSYIPSLLLAMRIAEHFNEPVESLFFLQKIS